MTLENSLKRRLRRALLQAIAFSFRPLVRNGPATHEPQRILVIRPDHLGDVLFTTPALRALRQAFPAAEITYLVGPWSATIVERNPNVDRIMRCEFPGFTRRRPASLVAPYVALAAWARWLRRGHYDMALNLRFDFWWGAALAYLADIPDRVGYAIREWQPFLTRAVPFEPMHAVDQNLTLVKTVAGAVQSPTVLEFSPTEEERDRVQQLLESRGVTPGASLIAIHPGSGSQVKLWAEERWAQVADALIERWGGQPVFTGSRDEIVLCQRILGAVAHPAISLAGELTIGELAALFEGCQLVLGVDSGPLHLATARDVPTIHLYGPSEPLLFGPWGEPARHRVLRTDFPCAPCGKLDYRPEELADHRCVWAIRVRDVLAAADQLLA
ncbi:MAG: glycosyltransferase family 9 protein [Chloroflexi bacterium]|nr:glycosyltransferase family 9 protein [Chloroflexota bacterium]